MHEPKVYPYQWDLNQMSDNEGNWIRFSYKKFNGNVSRVNVSGVENNTPAWNPANKYYTRESYVKQITTSKGTTVDFVLGDKDELEYYIPYRDVGDGKETLMPIYETKYLSSITVKNTFSSLAYLTKITLQYNAYLNGNDLNFKKRLLSAIVVENGRADAGVIGKTTTFFRYFTDETQASGSFGALRSVHNNAGGQIRYEYAKQLLSNTSNLYNPYKYQFPQIFNIVEPTIKNGTTDDGEDYYIIQDGNFKYKFYIMQWENSKWNFTSIDFPTDDEVKQVYAEKNCIMVVHGASSEKFKIYWWTGDAWKEELSETIESGVAPEGILSGGQFTLMKRENRELWCYRRDAIDGGWKSIEVNDWGYAQTDEDGQFTNWRDYTIHNGNTYYTKDENTDLSVYLWNGTGFNSVQYVRTPRRRAAYFPGPDYIVTYEDDGSEKRSAAFKNNGLDWVYAYRTAEGSSLQSYNATCGNNFFLAQIKMKYSSSANVQSWNGFNWKHTSSNFKYGTHPIGQDIVAVYEGNGFTIWKWDPQTFSWTNGAYGSWVDPGFDNRSLYIGNNFQVVEYHDNSNKYKALINIWDGLGWKKEAIEPTDDPNDRDHPSAVITYAKSYAGQRSYARCLKWASGVYGIIARRKVRDSFKDMPFVMVVKKKTISNGVDPKELVTTFSYATDFANQPYYNTASGSAMFKKVSVTQPLVGTTDYYFENVNGKLLGTLQKTSTKVNSSETEYETYQDASWPDGIYKQRSTKTIATIDKVATETTISYNNSNGLPNKSTTKNSDGKLRIQQTEFAFEKTQYASMKNKNMLTQPFSSKTLYQLNKTATAKVVQAQVTSWNEHTISATDKRWRPGVSYSWNSPCGADGLPSSAFAEFVIGGTNTPWVSSFSKVEKYDNFGRAIETSNKDGLYSATFLGNREAFPIASVTNARFDESAFYTCTYDNSTINAGYLDYEQGWEKCGGVLSTAEPHFGTSSIYIKLPAGGAFGPTNNIRLYKGKDYVMSCWVLVKSGTFAMYGDYRYITNASKPLTVSVLQKDFTVPAKTAGVSTNWKYVEMLIPASTDLTDWTKNWGARVYWGSPNGVEAYIDDLRFYPVNALSSVTYYDDDWRQAVLTVDANNCPSKKISYDGFGRPVKIEKRVPQKRASDVDAAVTLETKEYQTTDITAIPVEVKPTHTQIGIGTSSYLTWYTIDNTRADLTFDAYLGLAEPLKKIGTALTARTCHTGTLTKGSLYYWRIVSTDSKGKQVMSPTWNFRTVCALTAPALVSPLPNEEVVTHEIDNSYTYQEYYNDVHVSWNAVNDPAGHVVNYYVYCGQTAASMELVNYTGTTELNYTIPQAILPDDSDIYWKVEASDGAAGTGVFSEVRVFKTKISSY
jgi:hypothetical protein